MSELIDLLETQYFQSGLRVGLLALVVGFGLVLAARKGRRPLPIVGVLIAVAVTWIFYSLNEIDQVHLPGLVLLLVGVMGARIFGASDVVVALASAPGAIWLAVASDLAEPGWIRVALALIPVGGYLISDFDRRYDTFGLGVIFFMLATVGVFLAVPDTEWALVMISVTIPLTFLAWPKVGAMLGVEGSYLALALYILVTAGGGVERPASIVGGLACLGLLLIEPILVRMSPGAVALKMVLSRDWKGALIACVPQVVVVLACSRVAARFTNELPALIVVVVTYVATMAVAVLAVSRGGPQRHVG